jgi:hypothetical protein
MSLEGRLKVKRLALLMKLDDELQYVDRKDRVPELQILRTISKIDGFLLGMSYMRSKYIKEPYVPKGGNSVIDNQIQKPYYGDY